MSDEDINKRDRSPSFPYITLTLAVQRIEALYRSARGNAVRLSDAADDWGLSPTSSSTLRNAAALGAYGFLDDEGSGPDKRVRLTESAMRILGDTRPGVKEKLLQTAAFRPSLINHYYGLWRGGRPSDAHAVSTLIYDSNFTERAAKTFLTVYDDAITYVLEGDDEENLNVNSDIKGSDPILERLQSKEMLIEDRRQAPEASDSHPTPKLGSPTVQLTEMKEWISMRVSQDTHVKIIVDGQLDAKKIDRLIKVLIAQKEIMDDDF